MKELPVGIKVDGPDLHDRIANELLDAKSLAALIWLVEHGREIELSLRGEIYFITRDSSQKFVSVWQGKAEQSFDSVEELLTKAKVVDGTPLNLWNEIEIETVL